MTLYIGAASLLVFLALVSLAPQVGERLGALSVKKQTQESLAAALQSPSRAITLTFEASPQAVTGGRSATLTWSAENAVNCLASGGWQGLKPPKGRELVTPTQTTTYTLNCQESAEKSVTVVVPRTQP